MTHRRVILVRALTFAPELVRRFVELAGGPGKARIAILPMATSDAVATGAEKKAELDSLGAHAFVLNFTRAHADDDSLVRKLSTATRIWFPGGDERFDDYRQPVLAGIEHRGRFGLFFAHRAPGDRDNSRLGLHSQRDRRSAFIRRQRENRLISVVLERPSLLGVGIDEGTALKVTPAGQWVVTGRSAVMTVNARNSRITPGTAPSLGAVNVRISVLPAGSTYDPRSGEASLPAARD